MCYKLDDIGIGTDLLRIDFYNCVGIWSLFLQTFYLNPKRLYTPYDLIAQSDLENQF